MNIFKTYEDECLDEVMYEGTKYNLTTKKEIIKILDTVNKLKRCGQNPLELLQDKLSDIKESIQ